GAEQLEASLQALPTGSEDARPRTAPYFALGPVRAFVTITEGGLAVNSRMQVLGADALPIPGLYAAGSTGQGGVLLEGHGHHISWAFVSGRLAGKSIVE